MDRFETIFNTPHLRVKAGRTPQTVGGGRTSDTLLQTEHRVARNKSRWCRNTGTKKSLMTTGKHKKGLKELVRPSSFGRTRGGAGSKVS